MRHSHLIFRSAGMIRVLDMVDKAAPHNVPILLCGETGVGKEVIARLIHQKSSRSSQPFVALNCGALPRELAEAELFGHTKGAFTGSTAPSPGMFEMAHQGTIFLDELADMPLEVQSKLLRVLQDGEVRRVGSRTFQWFDVRVIASLNHAVAGNRLREDLYHRLSTITVNIPPLRERLADILPIAESVLAAQPRLDNVRRVRRFSPGAIEALQASRWPGNVRELINAVSRAAIMAPGELIEADDLDLDQTMRDLAPADPPTPECPPGPLTRTWRGHEKQLIESTLRELGGNKLATARTLKMGRQTLYNKLHRYGILVEPEPGPGHGGDESAGAPA